MGKRDHEVDNPEVPVAHVWPCDDFGGYNCQHMRPLEDHGLVGFYRSAGNEKLSSVTDLAS
jgi:hypothetical protein